MGQTTADFWAQTITEFVYRHKGWMAKEGLERKLITRGERDAYEALKHKLMRKKGDRFHAA